MQLGQLFSENIETKIKIGYLSFHGGNPFLHRSLDLIHHPFKSFFKRRRPLDPRVLCDSVVLDFPLATGVDLDFPLEIWISRHELCCRAARRADELSPRHVRTRARLAIELELVFELDSRAR
ncbi:hypothetical protein M5K25_015382 [Dendrobium thyrsiflorum]|uniref:Uncharacterized protein n=1 Tax=Dendrobium thyrsiflorum TaxID=117978 RepID=A0ABD0UQ46_DENTH